LEQILKPRSFEYRRASTIEEAYQLLAEYGDDGKIIAGGQSLVPMMNLRLVSPSILIDIAGIDSLREISCDGTVLRIGSLARHRQIESEELVKVNAPLLAKAVHHVAHLAVRNRGTFGGSVCHADPAAEFPACSLLLEASMEIGSARGIRDVPAAEFFHGPFTTSVEADELLLAVKIRVSSPGADFAFHELSRRQGDFAISGVAARAQTSGDILNTRWVAFGVSDRPILLPGLDRLFRGASFDTVDDTQIRVAVDEDLPDDDPDAEKVAMQKLLTSELVRRCITDFQSSGRWKGV
jgi:aerobic carbon-monoxide dehydrogenase medium subunit